MKFIIAVFSYILMVSTAFSQEVKKKDREQRIKVVSEKFSVSKKRGQKIVDALDFNSNEIWSLQRDPIINPKEKFLRLKILNAERERKIDSVLTKNELSLLASGILLNSNQQQSKKSFIEKEKQKFKLPPNGKLLRP